jgi:uncharacterized SAM-binding protein YcdF (DUF218 family)
MRALLSRLVLVLGLLVLAWAGGFAWFMHRTASVEPLPEQADGIVALTGGTERVETALHLLAEGRAGRLLISGVGGATEFAVLAHRAGVDPGLAPRVTLGRAALSTRGNAEETAAWARAHQLRTLIVVTADYHMPRALAELSRALPEVMLHPAPVQPAGLRAGLGLGGLRLLAGEYMKFLAAEVGLSGLAARALDRATAQIQGAGPAPSHAAEHAG